MFVSSNAPSIPVYNRFAILEEDPPIITKTWSDFIHPERIELPPEFLPEQTKSFPLHEPTPVMAPVDALFQLRYDMGQHGPIMTQREPTMAYGVKGCYKSPEAAQYRTLMVTTWNINGINGQKARLVVRLMKQDTSDILICVDTRHSEQTVKSLKKIFKEGLGAGTQVYFSKDPNRRIGEPGGIAIIIGPKWGPSYIYRGRADRTYRDREYWQGYTFAPRLASFLYMVLIGRMFLQRQNLR